MITNIFLNIIAISISTSLIIILLLVLAPLLNKRYAVKWKYLMWTVIAVRLIIPFHMDIPFPQILINVPTEITAPIDTNSQIPRGNKNDAPTMSPVEQKPAEIRHGNTMMAPSQTEQKPLKLTLLDIIAYLWLTGCLLFLSVHIISYLHYKGHITKNGMVVKQKYILQQVCRLSETLQIKPSIRILRYEDVESPMVVGLSKPILVLPDFDYSEEELFFILKHELIHIKRHDIFFKFLFMIANALHWFNPLVYMMKKEAVVDMELSCDEKVIQQTAYAVRKAYTETILCTLNRQHKKGTSLTTQFYGGKEIMKKRFKNILTKSPKKNGLLFCICAVCITIIPGMLIGCSAIISDSPEESVPTDFDTVSPGLADDTGTQADHSNTDISGDTQNEDIENPPGQPLDSAEHNYKSVLLGKSNFICTDLENKSLNISEIKQVVSDEDWVTASVIKFAVTDLDGDGDEEVALWIQANSDTDWGFEILDDQNGKIHGYTLWYRSFMNLKTDGTFSTSHSAADTGMGRITFSETGYSIIETYSETTYDAVKDEWIVEYFADNEPCSIDEFYEMTEGQEQKADVEWYDFSENNINAIL